MKAILLSAGQGRRLLPLTRTLPKCLLPVDGERTLLELQLRLLAAAGVDEVVVLVGFRADRIERFLATRPVPGLRVRTRYNPFFASTDNLVTAWVARDELVGEALLLNGDTLFEPAVLARLLDAADASIRVVTHRKARYDDDDMKVECAPDGRLRAIGKTLAADRVDAEAIGLLRMDAEGTKAFTEGLERAVREAAGLRAYYLAVIDRLARSRRVECLDAGSAWWGEVDSPSDLEAMRERLRGARG